MNHIKQSDIKQVYESRICKLEEDFFGGMKAGKTLEELKPILLKLKLVKLHLSNLKINRQQHSNMNNASC